MADPREYESMAQTGKSNTVGRAQTPLKRPQSLAYTQGQTMVANDLDASIKASQSNQGQQGRMS